MTMTTMKTVQRKSFTYATTVDWLGGKAAILAADGKEQFRVASPPEFRGERNVWTPEDLLVGAVETCLLMTFASIVQRQQLAVERYCSEAKGLLESGDDGYAFTRIVVKPVITIADDAARGPVLRAIQQAHRDCLIANSLRSTVIVEPEIRTISQA